jgi:RNA polymerase sigma-70 factor, ECF subfamily
MVAEVGVPGITAGVADVTVDAGRDALDLWRAHYPRLVGWCDAVVGDEAAAHDIAAEAFVRLLSRWRSVTEPKPFLYATAMNLMRDHWRAAARQARLVERLPKVAESQSDPRERWLTDLAGRLPDRLRGPVVLHYGADLSVAEVAAALRRPAGSVKRQLAEGRALLLAMIEEADR